METPIIPTAKAMKQLTCMKLIPENIMQTIIEEAKVGNDYLSFDDEFNVMTCEVIWALEQLGYKVYKHPGKTNESYIYTIKWI